MCTNKYSNNERYDKVIAKTKWCSFLCLTVYKLIAEKSLNVQFKKKPYKLLDTDPEADDFQKLISCFLF